MRRERRSRSTAVLPLASGKGQGASPPVRLRRTRARSTSRLRSHWPRYVLLAAALYGVAVGRKDVAEHLRLRQQAQALDTRIHAALQAQATLRARIAYAKTNAFVAAQARQQFGFVSPGAVPLAPIQPPATATAPVGTTRAGG